MSDKGLYIYTFATGKYQLYSDLWHFCIEHEYPEYKHKIYNTWGSPERHGWPPYYGAVMRHLIEPPIEYYPENCEYFYITDVDMFIVREEPTLLDFHLGEMETSGLCYSNLQRGPGEPEGVNRVTGLHFGHKSWYEATRAARDKYVLKVRFGEIGNEPIDDELTLAKVITESGLKMPGRGKLVTRHHGIHVGTIRDNVNDVRDVRRNAFRLRVTRPIAERWLNIIETQEYSSIFNKIQNYDRVITAELVEIERLCRQMCNERVRRK